MKRRNFINGMSAMSGMLIMGKEITKNFSRVVFKEPFPDIWKFTSPQCTRNNSGKYLDVTSGSTAYGANIEIWQNNGGNNQKFTFTLIDSNYFRITAVHSGKVLDVASSSTADGGNVLQWSWNGGNNQQWKLVPVSNADVTKKQKTLLNRKRLIGPKIYCSIQILSLFK